MKEQAISVSKLKEMQDWSHEYKVHITTMRLYVFCQRVNWNIAVSYSGGKDSTVLLDIACRLWAKTESDHPDRQLVVVFANTSNEHLGMLPFVKTTCLWMEQKHGIKIDLKAPHGDKYFWEIIRDNGYPIASKKIARQVREIREWLHKHQVSWNDIKDELDHGISSADLLRSCDKSYNPQDTQRGNTTSTVVSYLTGIKRDNSKGTCKLAKRWRPLIPAPFETSEICCNILKKTPIRAIEKKLGLNPVIGEMADDSKMREDGYKKTGCNAFSGEHKGRCKPMGFWLEQDVLWYHAEYKIPHFEAYGDLLCEECRYRFSGEQRTGCKLCLFGIMFDWDRLKRLNEREPQTVSWALRPISDDGLGYREVIHYLNRYCKCKIKI